MESNQQAQNAATTGIIEFTKRFAETTVKNFNGMLSADCTTAAVEFCNEGIVSPHNLYISVLFTGTVFGEFILAMNEETGARLIGQSFEGKSSEERMALQQEIADTFSELLNMIAGECIVNLSAQHKKLTITAPKVHFGYVRYPRVKSGKAPIHSGAGPIDCFLYVDRMKLDIAASYRKALSSLLVANRELQGTMKKLQEQQAHIVQSEKLAALGTMAAGVAHEINTPLATISMVEGQMKDLLGDEKIDKEAFEEMLDVIEKTIFRISKITNALRSYANDYSGAPFVATSAKELIDDAAIFCENHLQDSNVELRIGAIPPTAMVECRAAQLTQVIFSLLSNAVDAVGNLGEKWVQIECVEHETTVDFVVTDSGNGIPSHARGRIFDPFYTTKKIGHGTGLGLSLARGIVVSHNGTLNLNPKSEHTQFVIHMPKVQPKIQGKPEHQADEKANKKAG